jgi:ATP-dependent DNA ligase
LVDGSVRVFSRNGEESTSRFPDLIDMIKESCKPVASTFIIDAEVHNCSLPYNNFRLRYTFDPLILSETGF